jgi:SAM-dependent methyltransferase
VATAQQHYDELLAPIYVWMAGGLQSALEKGARDIAMFVPGAGLAIDLGAGFGMHAIPLSRGGYHVVAIDSSRHLLDVLRAESVGLSIGVVEDDLLDFRRHIQAPASLIVCLGDTLTHLAELADVERLCSDIATSLEPGGRVMLTFRDYSRPPDGVKRFIHVHSDADRIHTCFLEHKGERMNVHDIVHERDGAKWGMKVSSYPKLRLAPSAVAEMLRGAGLATTVDVDPRGMSMINGIRT